MKQESKAFEQVLKASPEAFVEARVSKVASAVSSLSSCTPRAR